MSHYENIASTGSGEPYAKVFLYANTPNQKSNCETGSDITSAIDTQFSSLVTAGSISRFELKRFKSENNKYPRVTTSDGRDKLMKEFNDFLTGADDNGLGINLKTAIGVHLLVHGDRCSVNTAGGEIHDHGTDCSANQLTAFDEGRSAWTGTCVSTGLRKNSAIQEPLHQFINWGLCEVRNLVADSDCGRKNNEYEHALGERYAFTGNATPMLVYHVSEVGGEGDCSSNASFNGYRQDLTTCTRDAVGITANNQCNSY